MIRFHICLLIFLYSSIAWSEDFVIAVGVPEESPLFAYWTNLFLEVEKRSGGTLDIEVKSMSLARARKALLDNTIDADAGRTVYVYEGEESIIKLEPPLYVNSYSVYAKDGLDIKRLEDLRKYRLATISGNAVVSRYVYENGLKTVFVNENEDALRMILYDRVDCLIATDLESPMLEETEFRGKGLIMYPEVIFQIEIYLYLSEDKSPMVPMIEGILYDLEREDKLRAYLEGEIP